MIRRKLLKNKSENYLPRFSNIYLEKRNVRKKTIDADLLRGGAVDHAPYRTVVTNGKYFYATGDDFLDLVRETGLDPYYLGGLPKYATENIFRMTEKNRSDSFPFLRLDMEIQGKDIIVTDNNGNKLKGEKDDFAKLKSWFASMPRRIRAFFVPGPDGDRVFLCLEADGEFGTMMLSY